MVTRFLSIFCRKRLRSRLRHTKVQGHSFLIFPYFRRPKPAIMKTLPLLILLFLSQHSFAQFNLTTLDKNSIPKGINYTGHIVNAVRWTDSLGDNIVITTETGPYDSKTMAEDGYRDAALYAYHYLLQQDSFKLTWKVYDFTKDCPVDIRADYIKKTFAITDLNNDGTAEIWLMYRTVCHGDVSPSNMKIIMYESNRKYAIRGTNRVQISETEKIGGEYMLDDAFKKAPAVFRLYAETLWKKNLMEHWD